MIASICAYAGEQTFERQLRDAKIKQIKFESEVLIEVAKSLPLGRERLSKALPYLLSEYGRSIGNKFTIDWQNVPSRVILDYVYGIDTVFQFRGWNIGVDITTNSTDIKFKVNKIKQLQPLWSAIGIEYCAVVLVERTAEQSLSITQLLRKVIKGETFISLS